MSSRIDEGLANIPMEYRLALLNSALFLMLAGIQNSVVQTESLTWILLPNITFFISSVIIWAFMMQRGWCLAPISWFILGSGLFFGFGVIAGGLHAHPWSAELYGDDTSYLLQVNLLNSVSVFIVLLATLFFIGGKKTPKERCDLDFGIQYKNIILAFSLFSMLIVFLRFYFFPDTYNLILRSILAKAYFFLPAAFLILGFINRKIGVSFFILLGVMFFQIAYGVLQFNKYEILMPCMACLAGSLIFSSAYKKPLKIILAIVVIFWISNPLVAIGRLDYRYDPNSNTLLQRVEILSDVVKASYGGSVGTIRHLTPAEDGQKQQMILIDMAPRTEFWERFRAIGVRFDVASIQGYLIKEYEAGRSGDSLKDFWAAIVPRVFWPSKPIVTRFGSELNVQYYKSAVQASSSIAPTYDGEAYWNYGWLGLILISAYLGLTFGFFTRIALKAGEDKNIAYFLVAFHLILPAVFVESWIASTYIGGLVTVIVYYFLIKSLLECGKKIKPSKLAEKKAR